VVVESSRRDAGRTGDLGGHGDHLHTGAGTTATVILMQLVGIVRLALVERRHVDLLRCASALCPA
jgi:hypothetical protein